MVNTTLNPILQTAIADVMSQLNTFAQDPLFTTNLVSIFGQNAAKIKPHQFLAIVNSLPTIEIQTASNLQGALGAFSTQTNTIYLSDSLLSPSQSNQLTAVLLEEIGHYLDSRLNKVDTKGDEGELFSAVVRGVSLSASGLSRIKAENDQAVITVNGQALRVERSTFLVGYYDTPGFALDVQVVGNYAYVTDYAGLQIIDISNPAFPIFKGSYSYGSRDDTTDVTIVGNYACVADHYEGLQIIDISNPALPVFKNSYNTQNFYWLRDVEIVGNFVYTADASGLKILDISNSTSLISNYYTPGYAGDVEIVGNLAYVTYTVSDGSSGSGVHILDISDPNVPVFKGSYNTPSSPSDVEIVGNLAYVTDGNLQILDISNPASPVLKGNYNTPDFASDVEIAGNLAYIADGGSGVQILDISNPANPVFKALYSTPYSATAVKVVGNKVYVTCGQQGIYIFDAYDNDLVAINLSPNNQTIIEGFTSPQTLSYEVSLSSSSTQMITVRYSTTNGTALSGSDYTEISGILTFNPGVTSQTINISILNNSIDESDETFALQLTNPTNAILGALRTVTTTITDTLTASTTTTLPGMVENLKLTGTVTINGTGNANNNIITGNSANNILDGGAGNDVLKGGAGDDTYLVDSIRDVVTENANEGQDLVQATVNTTLTNNVEDLTLLGTANINGTGNNANNILTGNSGANLLKGLNGNDTLSSGAGNDTLIGGLGNDRLTGEAGADQFLFGSSSAFKTSNLGVDTLTDFTKNSDKIALSKVTFNALSSPIGTLQTAEFIQINSLSNELSLVGSSSAKMVYNVATGNLFYNPDGAIAGLTNGGQFASLSTRPSLTFADFTVQS